MRYAPRAILSGILGFAASLVVACGGGSGLLSGGQASTLSGQLDRISAAVQQRDCGGASSATAALASAVNGLPATVNTTLRRNLNQGVATVAQLAQHDCRTTAAATPPRTTTSSTSSSTSSSTTTTTQTTTTSTPTQTHTVTVPTPTTTPPATTPTPPGTTSTGSGGAGLGGGGGNSSGGAGNGQNSNGKNSNGQ